MHDHQSQSPPACVYKATYTYTLADYRAARAKRRLNPFWDDALWQWRYVSTFGFALVFAIFVIWSRDLTAEKILSWDFLSLIGIFILGLNVFLVLVDVVFDRILPRWVFKRLSIADTTLTMTFSDDGIFWSGEGFKGEIIWSRVMRLVTLEDSLFLFISKLQAFCVPQRAFASKDTFDSFTAYAKERVNG